MGFFYLQSRYYDPSIMRFINADDYELISTLASTIGQLNLYAYCNDNPIMYTDESGTVITEIAASVLSYLLLAIGVILCVYLIYYAISQIDFSALIDYFNEIGEFTHEQIKKLEEKIIGYIIYESEHTKNANPSNLEKHQRGQARKNRDKKGGEKGDSRRKYTPPRKKVKTTINKQH